MAIPDTTTSTSGTSGATSQQNNQGASGMMSKVRERATEQLSSQKNKATDGLGSVAQAVRQSTQQLRDQQHETLAGYVERAADQIDRLSHKLRDKDIGELVEDAQRLARRQPALFIGSAFVLGVLGARFMKSSPPRNEYDGDRLYGGGYQGGGSYGQGTGYTTPGTYGGTTPGTYGSSTSTTAVSSGTGITRTERS